MKQWKKTTELKKTINHMISCVSEFSDRFKKTDKDAFNYLYDHQGIAFLIEFYDVEHTLSFEDANFTYLYWNDQISSYNRSAYYSRQTMLNSTYLCVRVYLIKYTRYIQIIFIIANILVYHLREIMTNHGNLEF